MKIHDLFIRADNEEKLMVRTVNRDGVSRISERVLINEHELVIAIDEKPVMRLVCTAVDLTNLTVGRLISEGIIEGINEIESIYICEGGHRARVFLSQNGREKDASGSLKAAGNENALHALPTCCTDNVSFITSMRPLRKIQGRQWTDAQDGEDGAMDEIGADRIFELAENFAQDGRLHKGTGGTHSAYLMYRDRVVYSCEDIGRHNALDKAIGEMAVKGYDPIDCLIYTTGRVPVDMVRKAIRAGIGGLVSKAVPTAQAAELSREYGLRLFCRAWPDSYDDHSRLMTGHE